ncbi:hypothetical protein MATL_G00125500 [Megalops atlanticus]|uniref:MAM domain-containing protein n=1 Tax=Megalops atlanticus TaxID=7932 RepID=A0A9D3PVF2_MEGAT|nr:hypothetical protein MATL_G00125500 [Megalops atlanticus]
MGAQRPDRSGDEQTHGRGHLEAAGCTFDEDSDPSLCEYTQGEEDDFDWQLIRTYSSPHTTSDLLREPCLSVAVYHSQNLTRLRHLTGRVSPPFRL